MLSTGFEFQIAQYTLRGQYYEVSHVFEQWTNQSDFLMVEYHNIMNSNIQNLHMSIVLLLDSFYKFNIHCLYLCILVNCIQLKFMNLGNRKICIDSYLILD